MAFDIRISEGDIRIFEEGIDYIDIRIREGDLEYVDVLNGNIDVYVTLPDKFELLILVGTPRSLQYLMDEEGADFYNPGRPWIFVRKLTKEIIYEAIKAYIESEPDAYWLKLHYFAPRIDPAIFNQMRDQELKMQQDFEIKEQEAKDLE